MKTTFVFSVILIVGCSNSSLSTNETVDVANTQGNTMDWIFVRRGTPELIKAAIISHSDIVAPEKPRTFTVTIKTLTSGGHAVVFSDKPPPYAFANLISWLHEPPAIENVSDATGWYTSRATDVRYFLRPDDSNPNGDTLFGADENGTSISVYLPDLSVCEVSSPISHVADADVALQDLASSLTFDVVLDVDEAFGNFTFELTHAKDSRW